MRNNSFLIALMLMCSLLISCEKESDEKVYLLERKDITVDAPDEGFSVLCNQLLKVSVTTVSDEGVAYQWLLDEEPIAETKELQYMFEECGEYNLQLKASQADRSFSYDFKVTVTFGDVVLPPEGSSPYVTKVLDYLPAVGQFINKMPQYEEGDTQQSMNEKVLSAIGNNNKGTISLGGFGGYVVVGFDHTIKNEIGKRDFRIIGNAFYSASNPDLNAPQGGSCEPGVIVVAYDANGNGKPDDNEWYEIAGSSHIDPSKELWYQKAVDVGNTVTLYSNYQITYHRPTDESQTDKYLFWEDNQGHSGYKTKNAFHQQCYYPLWATTDRLTFKGTCLPQNGIDESGSGSYYVLYKFRYGYADNEKNDADESAIDISWAVNSKGQKVNLPGVDFIKIYTGVNQENGWLGECSTEVTSVEDLHLLGIDINTRN